MIIGLAVLILGSVLHEILLLFFFFFFSGEGVYGAAVWGIGEVDSRSCTGYFRICIV